MKILQTKKSTIKLFETVESFEKLIIQYILYTRISKCYNITYYYHNIYTLL